MPFKKGQIGNPNGTNTRKQRQIQELLLPYVADAVQVLVDSLKSKDDKIAAAKDILNRVYGTPAQAIEVSGAIETIIVNVVRKEK